MGLIKPKNHLTLLSRFKEYEKVASSRKQKHPWVDGCEENRIENQGRHQPHRPVSRP
jgi:hypothetical protein